MKHKGALFCLALALLTGCASLRTLDAAKPGAPLVYSGTRLDWYALQGGCCAKDRFGAQAPAWPQLDLPASAVFDTVVLPLALLVSLGVNYRAQGGL
ncbi:YceK/YidQ family lipoprotein [Pseudomonas typographi]|uniref:YceK/YidQ family lipoprotein n=1 Tax=Pseudomonas typographi TaxID=2715964 RepID=A0ABR7Z4X6_9PSED|nr:YceK/YidQ family lipoprotein [Pseudomonas typographi]MBD1553107.1 YceK/YidQ family lipoprotein [Pseudomonas typographi]MBD1590214.1 YceK/YidQ family lipoprotein [Pseudomonas typographi]MBD1600559.1 YceK/YidQ family lipoprotein [Pseudomonas typographi]